MHLETAHFIQDLAIIMALSGMITILFHKLKQPVVLGYIIAGIIIGPYTPPFSLIQDQTTIQTLGELGVIFLMFSLGLEFDLHKLHKVGVSAFIAAACEIILMSWIGYGLGQLFGWSNIDSVFLGAILAISSTTIIIKALEELGLKQELFAQLTFGILIIEDIFAISILAILTSMALTGTLDVSDIFENTLKVTSFLVTSLVVGILLIPKFITKITKFKNEEMLLIATLGFCFGFCLLVVKLGYSIALGAFIMGVVIAESPKIKVIERLVKPLRDMFSAIFFVSVGLLFNPKIFLHHGFAILVITLAVIIGKVVTTGLGAFLTGSDPKSSLRVGMSLAQIGEFSFIIAALGITAKVTSDFLFPIAVAVSAITTFTTPYLIKYSDTLANNISKHLPTQFKKLSAQYTTTVKKISFLPEEIKIKHAIQRNSLKIVINFFFVVAIFVIFTRLANTHWNFALAQLMGVEWNKAIFWSAAFTCSLPFLIAIYRKTQSFITALFSWFNKHPYTIVLETFAIFATVGTICFIEHLCATIAPKMGILIPVTLVIFALGIRLYDWFVHWHTHLQSTLVESMKKTDKQI